MTKTINRHSFALLLLTAALSASLLGSCKKNNEIVPGKSQASKHSSYVLDKWMTLQLRLIKNATGVPNHAFSRHFAYSGIAAYEALKPGLSTKDPWSSKWNGLTALPAAGDARNYYYPANVNGAMATSSRLFFPNANAADKAAVDSLETALNQEFLLTETQARINTSLQFGGEVANAVFNWAETDGYKNANAPYTPPAGPGLWKPTPPAMAAAATPYWGNNRPIISGSTNNTQPTAPIAYSTDENSGFYQMVKQVHNVSLTLTDDQKAMATFWRDIPGISSPGHWLSILQQVIQKDKTALDKAALAYALTGTAVNDALISCFKTKYQYNLVRPISYIREVMGQGTWNSFLGTPAHPEYPSAHSSLSAAAADVIQELFGNSGSFTDHSYDYLGFTPRTYSSFSAIAEEAGLSRLYAGIHYTQSITAGLVQGQKVTANIFSGKK